MNPQLHTTPPEIQAIYDRLTKAGYDTKGPGHWGSAGRLYCSVMYRHGGEWVRMYGHGATWGDVAAMMLKEWGER